MDYFMLGVGTTSLILFIHTFAPVISRKVNKIKTLYNAINNIEADTCSHVIKFSDTHVCVQYMQNGTKGYLLLEVDKETTFNAIGKTLWLRRGDTKINITPPQGVTVTYNLHKLGGDEFFINNLSHDGNIVTFPPNEEEEIFE